ncbi:MAG TPA: PAS domain S-box protein, partial [Ktedonobacterales bacterium]|nr:PAS domain S-box protein [Ktedonobacterales bacterium]
MPESEQLFRTAFERTVIGIAHVSPQGRWLRFNQRLCDLLGYDRAELAALTFQDVTYPDDFEPCRASFQRLLAGEIDEYAMDKRYIRKDGALVWAHIAVSLVRTPEGAPDFTIAMIQDISERKRLEQERTHLLEQERAARLEAEATNGRLGALQALTDTALSSLALDDLLRELLGRVHAVMGVDNVAILLLDEDGQTLTLRAIRGEEVGGVGRTKIPLGRGVAGRIAARAAPLIVDDTSTIDMVYPWHRETLRSVVGVPLLAEGHLVGVVLVGSVSLRRFTEADVQLLQHAADRIGLAVGRARLYAAEQDARRQAEAALTRAQASEAQASERAEQLHTILETMTDGVAVTDAEGRYRQTNRAYRELLTADRLPGFDATLPAERGRLLDVRDPATGAPLPPERIPTARALRGEVVTGPGADLRARALDGRELAVNSNAAPLRDSEGHIVGAVSVLRDVTWRRQLEREREAAREQAERQADQLDRIFEAAADGLTVWDAEGRIVRTN